MRTTGTGGHGKGRNWPAPNRQSCVHKCCIHFSPSEGLQAWTYQRPLLPAELCSLGCIKVPLRASTTHACDGDHASLASLCSGHTAIKAKLTVYKSLGPLVQLWAGPPHQPCELSSLMVAGSRMNTEGRGSSTDNGLWCSASESRSPLPPLPPSAARITGPERFGQVRWRRQRGDRFSTLPPHPRT